MPDTHVTIVGNLTEDPEVTFTPNGAAVCNFRLAVTARIKDGEGWRDGDTSFTASPPGEPWPSTSATPWPRATGSSSSASSGPVPGIGTPTRPQGGSPCASTPPASI